MNPFLRMYLGVSKDFVNQTEKVLQRYERKALENIECNGVPNILGLSSEQAKRFQKLELINSEIIDNGCIERNPIMTRVYEKGLREQRNMIDGGKKI